MDETSDQFGVVCKQVSKKAGKRRKQQLVIALKQRFLTWLIATKIPPRFYM